MSQTTHIEWASHTASPWFGCTEVSPGCANCYARELTLNHKWAGWGDKSPRVRSKGFWKDAYRWDRKAGEANEGLLAMDQERPRIFTSLMDWLDPRVPIEWLADFLKVVHDCKNLDWLLLTKRPELWKDRILEAQEWLIKNGDVGTAFFIQIWFASRRQSPPLAANPPQNIWFGITIENQAMADKRIPILLSIPAKVRWLSVEPLLEPISFNRIGNENSAYNVLSGKQGWLTTGKHVDWVVVGGESGGKRRDCGVEAIVNVAEQCKAAGVPCFVKQDVAQRPGQQGRIPAHIWKMKEFPK